MTPPSSTDLARAVVAALRRHGIEHVILCPGSRSAPLAYALADAEDAGWVRLHVRHDERVAGFCALGIGRAGTAAAVVTTSGTAVANLHPAVLEAHHAGVPLLVLSADRPVALRGTWANQTTDLQPDLFGAALRARLDLTTAAEEGRLDDALAGLRGPAGRRPGPVQVNVCLAEPLVPQGSSAWPATPSAPPAVVLGDEAAEHPTVLARGPRTVVVAGAGAGPQALELARATGWPLLAEPSSGARSEPAIGPYRLLLDLPGLGGAVQRAVVFGRPTLSRPVTRLVERADVEVVLVAGHPEWPVATRPARRARVVELDGGGPDDAEWIGRWAAAGKAAQGAVDGVLDRILDGGAAVDGRHVARAVARLLVPGEPLVVAASNPVRDLDLAGGVWPDGVAVHANRGLSGIDGTLSTATGVALATGCPTRALVGDLAFLHDLGALLLPPGERVPDLQVVVVNDRGGGIFSLLEYGALAERDSAAGARFERLFGTPQDADLAALCAGFGVRHRRVTTAGALDRVLSERAPGIEVVEVCCERSGLRRLQAAMARTVVDAVGQGLNAF